MRLITWQKCYFTSALFFLQLTGQPVLIGGTMGTCSYVLTGTEQGMTETFGTTCHGAVSHRTECHTALVMSPPVTCLPVCLWTLQGRALSRAKSRRNLDFQDVLDKLADKGIAIRVASPKLVMEEVRLYSDIQTLPTLLYFHFKCLRNI